MACSVYSKGVVSIVVVVVVVFVVVFINFSRLTVKQQMKQGGVFISVTDSKQKTCLFARSLAFAFVPSLASLAHTFLSSRESE